MRFRSFPFFAVAALLLASLGMALPGPAQATSHLAVDAGGSQGAWDGGVIQLNGAARGGVAPYAYAWSFSDPTRFSSTTVEDPTFSAAGLATGNHTLTLTVTDSVGSVASDSVKIRAAPSKLLLSTTTTTYVGVDDEQYGESLDSRTFAFSVPARIDKVRASLSWTDAAADLDLSLLDPWQGEPAADQGHAGTNPETVEFADPFPGGWSLRVEPKNGARTTFTVVARGGDITYFPDVWVPAFEFGAGDVQTLTPLGRATVGPYTYEWDLNHDGWFETPGEVVTSSLPVGTHLVTVRVTDANGFTDDTTTTVTIRPGDTIRHLICGGESGKLWAMEYTASRGTCWIHGGHHTYYFGGDVYAFRAARGWAYSVEQQYAPSSDVVNTSRPAGTTPLYVEVSVDGIAWTTVGHGLYSYTSDRQTVWLDVAGNGESFRFLRLSVPLSLSQGLSGYLDHSSFAVEMDDVAAETLVAAGSSKSLDCETDLLEDFFATHPCWFGGIDRYDSPSFFHTYVVGPESDLTRISGNFTLAPWRSDDYNRPIPTASSTATKAYVQVSANGVDWTDVALVNATYGVEQSFNVFVNLDDVTFVRLFPEYHANFDQWQTLAPLHHPRAYFLDSSIAVNGALKAWA